MNMAKSTLSGTLLDDQANYSLKEICSTCSVHIEWVVELVEEGILEPAGDKRSQWQFSGNSISRVVVARRLQNDLEINLPGVALAIQLLEEIDQIRARLRIQGANEN
jgi:chaperone modulatory protein CbpM